MVIVRKSVSPPAASPCREPSSQLPQLVPMMSLLANPLFDAKYNLLDGYKAPPTVFIPTASASSKAAHRGHLVVFKMHSFNTDKKMLEKRFGADGIAVLSYGEDGRSIDIEKSSQDAWKKIEELEEKQDRKEELSVTEQTFLDASKSKTSAHRSSDEEASEASTDAGSATHPAPRVIAARGSERAPGLALAILARFFPIAVGQKLLVLDACSGTGSVARAMLTLKGMDVAVGCVSVDIDPIIVSYSQLEFRRQLEKFHERLASMHTLGDIQNESDSAKRAKDATSVCSGAKVSTCILMQHFISAAAINQTLMCCLCRSVVLSALTDAYRVRHTD